MEKMLITGASGFLGSRIVEFYSKKYDIYTPTHKELDITKNESVLCFFDKYRPDVVIHCAAVSDVGLCEKEPEMSYRINVEGSVNVAKESKKIQAKCIVCSSDQVYFGSAVDEAHSEEEVLSPFNIYGKGKLKAEQECLAVNSDCVLLRLSWMYDTKTIRKEEHGDFFRTLLSRMKENGKLVYPVYDKRGITDVNEVVSNLEKTFQISGGIYNFGSANNKSTFDTVYAIFEKMKWDVNRLHKNEEAFQKKPRNLCMSQEKIEGCGISFSTTESALLSNILKVIK